MYNSYETEVDVKVVKTVTIHFDMPHEAWKKLETLILQGSAVTPDGDLQHFAGRLIEQVRAGIVS